jgi:hypothetical protein
MRGRDDGGKALGGRETRLGDAAMLAHPP